MALFAILLGGDLTVTPRLLSHVRNARFIAADSGMMHAAALRIVPELWVGDFDSSGSELTIQYRDVPRDSFPAEKDATDGAIAIAKALERGATEIMLLGGLGGQADHATGILGQGLQLAQRRVRCVMTSGFEEAYPLLPGELLLDLPDTTRLSLIPFSDITGLDLHGVKWPLRNRNVPLGSTLTMSNVVTGPVQIKIQSGHGIAIAYPPIGAND